MQPKKYSITLLNDDVTTRDQALQIIMHVFGYNIKEALVVVDEIDQNGRAVIGEFIHEIAETKLCEIDSVNQLNDIDFRAIVNYDDLDEGLEQFKADVQDKFDAQDDTPTEE